MEAVADVVGIVALGGAVVMWVLLWFGWHSLRWMWFLWIVVC